MATSRSPGHAEGRGWVWRRRVSVPDWVRARRVISLHRPVVSRRGSASVFRRGRGRACKVGSPLLVELLQAARGPAWEMEAIIVQHGPLDCGNHPTRPCLARLLECKALLRPKRGYWAGER